MGMSRLYGELWTAEMVRAFPADGNRYEVIDGELIVTPSPNFEHQWVVGEFHVTLHDWTLKHGVGVTMLSPADLQLEPEGLVQPDVFVAPPVPDGDMPRSWTDITTLVLAIEVLSPSTAQHDRGRKRELFARVRVPEYWIADARHRVIERGRPDDELPELCNRTLVWHPTGAGEPLVIDVAKLFRDALDR